MLFQKNISNFIIIDDDSISNMLSKHIIKSISNDCQITDFTDALSALNYIRTSTEKSICNPTIILLDINMPILNGWEFIEEFEKLSPIIKNAFKIYLLSSSVDTKDKMRAESNTIINSYLVKPVTQNMMLQILAEPTSHTIIPTLHKSVDFA